MAEQVELQPKQAIHKEHSFWLLPAEPLRTQLRSIIRQLAMKHGASEFEPHVSLSCAPSDDDQTRIIGCEIASLFSPVELTPVKLDYTSEYTKTLFIQFQASEAARRLSDAIKDRSAETSNYVLNPHLSLLYKTMPKAAQDEACRLLNVPKGTYFFDRLQAIETELPLTEPEQIKRWRVVFECALGQ
jgi:sulfur relay (sulfurtransferase) DsrC/TusE family protein